MAASDNVAMLNDEAVVGYISKLMDKHMNAELADLGCTYDEASGEIVFENEPQDLPVYSIENPELRDWVHMWALQNGQDEYNVSGDSVKEIASNVVQYWKNNVYEGKDRFGNRAGFGTEADYLIGCLTEEEFNELYDGFYGKEESAPYDNLADKTLAENGNFSEAELVGKDVSTLEDEWLRWKLISRCLDNRKEGVSEVNKKYVEDILTSYESVLGDRGINGEELDTYLAVKLDCLREQAREGGYESLSEADVDFIALADFNGTDPSLIMKYASLSDYDRETEIRFKSVLNGPTMGIGDDGSARWDTPVDEAGTVLNEGMSTQCVVTQNKNGTFHCESEYLGSFDYNPDEFAIGYKEVPGTEGEDGSCLKVPVLKCIKKLNFYDALDVRGRIPWNSTTGVAAVAEQQVKIPDGVRCMDYMFEGKSDLQFIPEIPDTVESAHCAFMNCNKLIDESIEFHNGSSIFGLVTFKKAGFPEGLKDFSNIFQGCSKLGDIKAFSDMPASTLTIDGMCNGCKGLFEAWYNTIAAKVFGKGDAVRWLVCGFNNPGTLNVEKCDNLTPAFADPQDGTCSESFKRASNDIVGEVRENYEEAKNAVINKGLDGQDAIDTQDAISAEVAAEGKNVLGAVDEVDSIDKVAYQPETKENPLGSLIQKGAVAAAFVAGLKGVTGFFTDNKFIKWAVGLGGTALLYAGGKLPASITPAIKMVEELFPEGDQFRGMLAKFRTWLGDDEEAKARAREEQMDDYRELALGQSLYTGVENAVGYDITGWMRTNGASVAKNDVLHEVGVDGYKSADKAGDVMRVACNAMTQYIDMLRSRGYTDEQIAKEAHDLAMRQLDGLEAYSVSARDAISAKYSNRDDRDAALNGLKYVNQHLMSEYWQWVIQTDGVYHFLTEEDYQRLIDADIEGVDMTSYRGIPSVGNDKDTPEEPVEDIYGVETNDMAGNNSGKRPLPFDGEYDEDNKTFSDDHVLEA